MTIRQMIEQLSASSSASKFDASLLFASATGSSRKHASTRNFWAKRRQHPMAGCQSEACFVLAKMYHTRCDFENALKWYYISLCCNSDNVCSLFGLAQMYVVRFRDYRSAKMCLQRLRALMHTSTLLRKKKTAAEASGVTASVSRRFGTLDSSRSQLRGGSHLMKGGKHGSNLDAMHEAIRCEEHVPSLVLLALCLNQIALQTSTSVSLSANVSAKKRTKDRKLNSFPFDLIFGSMESVRLLETAVRFDADNASVRVILAELYESTDLLKSHEHYTVAFKLLTEEIDREQQHSDDGDGDDVEMSGVKKEEGASDDALQKTEKKKRRVAFQLVNNLMVVKYKLGLLTEARRLCEDVLFKEQKEALLKEMQEALSQKQQESELKKSGAEHGGSDDATKVAVPKLEDVNMAAIAHKSEKLPLEKDQLIVLYNYGLILDGCGEAKALRRIMKRVMVLSNGEIIEAKLHRALGGAKLGSAATAQWMRDYARIGDLPGDYALDEVIKRKRKELDRLRKSSTYKPGHLPNEKMDAKLIGLRYLMAIGCVSTPQSQSGALLDAQKSGEKKGGVLLSGNHVDFLLSRLKSFGSATDNYRDLFVAECLINDCYRIHEAEMYRVPKQKLKQKQSHGAAEYYDKVKAAAKLFCKVLVNDARNMYALHGLAVCFALTHDTLVAKEILTHLISTCDISSTTTSANSSSKQQSAATLKTDGSGTVDTNAATTTASSFSGGLHFQVLVNLGNIHLIYKEWKPAILNFEKALKKIEACAKLVSAEVLVRNRLAVLLLLARAHFGKCDYRKCKEILFRSLRYATSDPRLVYDLAYSEQHHALALIKAPKVCVAAVGGGKADDALSAKKRKKHHLNAARVQLAVCQLEHACRLWDRLHSAVVPPKKQKKTEGEEVDSENKEEKTSEMVEEFIAQYSESEVPQRMREKIENLRTQAKSQLGTARQLLEKAKRREEKKRLDQEALQREHMEKEAQILAKERELQWQKKVAVEKQQQRARKLKLEARHLFETEYVGGEYEADASAHARDSSVKAEEVPETSEPTVGGSMLDSIDDYGASVEETSRPTKKRRLVKKEVVEETEADETDAVMSEATAEAAMSEEVAEGRVEDASMAEGSAVKEEETAESGGVKTEPKTEEPESTETDAESAAAAVGVDASVLRAFIEQFVVDKMNAGKKLMVSSLKKPVKRKFGLNKDQYKVVKKVAIEIAVAKANLWVQENT